MNEPQLIPRRVLSVVTVLGMLVASLVLTGSVASEGAPFDLMPGYPLKGCYGVVTAGTGMWGGSGTITVDVPGPVVDAFLWWAGSEDDDLIINGSTVVGTLLDSTPTIPPGHPDWYLYRADVSGLVSEGANTLSIEGWEGIHMPYKDLRNGATLVVTYERDPACLDPVEIQVYEGFDWFWHADSTGEFASEVEAYFLETAPFDRTARVTFSYAGADHEAAECRDGTVWYTSGTGVPPDQLLDKVWPETQGVNGGVLVAESPFSPEPPCTPTIHSPATGLEGGFIGAEWSVATLEVTVPAGDEWVAFQMESPAFRNGVLVEGESGAWVGNVLEIPLPTPDVTVTKDDGETNVSPGDTLDYIISYANIGDRFAEDVVIVDTIPDRTTFVECYTPVGTCSEAGGVVTFELGTLDPGDSGLARVTVQLDPIFPCGDTPITNEVSISTTTPGDDPSNNADEDTDIVTAYVTVDIEKSAAPEPVEAGAPLTYTLDWAVAGNCWAENTTITDTVPALTSFVSCEPAGVCSESGGVVTWDLDTLTPPDSGTVSFMVQVDTCLPDGELITNTAYMFEDSGSTDEDTVISTVSADHELHIDKVGDPKPVMKTEPLTYTILWEITGNEPATNVVITDVVPDGTTFDSATGGGVYDPVTNIVTWNLGDFCPPASGSVSFTAIVDRYLVDPAEISDTAFLCDDDPGTACAQDQDITPVIPTSEIGDLVWLDEDGDAVQDAGEAGIPNVVLNLYDAGADAVCGTADDTWLDTRTTDADGWYLFDLLLAGDYCVDVDDATLPYGVFLSPGLTDPHGPITLNPEADPDEQYLDADFGYYPGGSIGDFVWLDEDGDAVQDAGEPGIAGVTLNLYDAGADGLCATGDDVLLDSDVTDADGLYLFEPLPIGTYCVDVDEATLPVGVFLSPGVAEPHGPIALGPAEDYLVADFGYYPGGSIGDLVWLDGDGDAVQDAGEAGIAGVTLNLLDVGADGLCGTADDTLLDSDVTDAGGMYLFEPLPIGDYCVDVDEATLPADVFLSPGVAEPHGPIALGPAEDYLVADFGYYPGGSIGDFVWLDEDRDGAQDAGEAGIAGVTVSLYDAGADGLCATGDDVLLDSDVTDADGLYLFDPLPIGTYCADVDETTVPEGLNLSFGIQDPHGPISLGAWEDYLDADFGFAYPDLVITKAVDKEYVHRHEDLVFTVTVSNEGPGPAHDVMVTDEISEYLTYIRLNVTKGTAVWNSGTREVTWSVGTLDEGDVEALTITGRVIDIPTADLPVTITNVAEVGFGGAPEPEQSNETVTQVVYFVPGEIPEPSTVLLLGSGLLSLAGYAQLRLRRRRRGE